MKTREVKTMQIETIETKLSGTLYKQFGHPILYTQIRLRLFDTFFDVDEEVQRQIDPAHRNEIKQFIVQSFEQQKSFYFAPFIFSARGQIEAFEDYFIIKPGQKLFISDGQHRSLALLSAITELIVRAERAESEKRLDDAEKYRKYVEQLKNMPIALQIYLDLTKQQERQLFTDLNSQRKEANANIRLQHDQRDEYNVLTRTIAEELKHQMEIDTSTARLSPASSAITSLSAMKKCLIALFEGIIGRKSGETYLPYDKQQALQIAEQFFLQWNKIFPKKAMNRDIYVAGLSGIQIALAFTVFNLSIQNKISHQEAIKLLPLINRHCTWKHNDPMFKHLFDKTSKKVRSHSSTTAITKTTFEFLIAINKENGVK